jgi:hypothetical protein
MCAAAAVGDGATLQPGVDDHCDAALSQLLGHWIYTRGYPVLV